MGLTVREAARSDAAALAEILNAVIALGGTTAHRGPFDAERIIQAFLAPERFLSCFAALDESGVVGFQALEWVDPDFPGERRLPADWAIISTYVSPAAHGGGVGRALFAATKDAAAAAGAAHIDATIRKENWRGLGYYGALGFVDYREDAETVSKRFDVAD